MDKAAISLSLRTFITGALTVTALSSPVLAGTTCGKEKLKSGLPYAFCVSKDSRSKSQDIIYYLHGAQNSEKAWVDNGMGAQLSPIWKKLKFEVPPVVTVSFGPIWYLTDFPAGGAPAALLSAFTDEIMPKLEAKLGGVKGQRLLVGPSMGGFNAAELSLRYPGRFSRVALLCPGLAVVNPFLPDAEIEAFLKTQPPTTKAEFVWGLVQGVRGLFVSEDNWKRHDPGQLTTMAANPFPSSYYVSCAKDDPFGIFPGAKNFAAQMADKTFVHFESIESGGHCAETEKSLTALATFLAGKN